MINYIATCLILLLGQLVPVGEAQYSSYAENIRFQVVLRQDQSVRGGETLFYHGDHCEVGFPTNGDMWSQIYGDEGLWHIDFRPNSNSFCKNNKNATQIRYKLQKDGNLVVRCRGKVDYMTHSNQGEKGNYMLVIDNGCTLHILKGTVDCDAVDIEREIWTSDIYKPMGPGDRLYKGQILHKPSYMKLVPDTGALELREEMSHGTYEVLWSSAWEWKAPPGPELHDYYAKVTNGGHLILVGIKYRPKLSEIVYFDKDLHSKGASCFTLGYEPNEQYLEPAELIAVPCDD